MIYQTPVHVNDVDGQVAEAGPDYLVVFFYAEENFRRLNAGTLGGQQVRIIVDPPIQLSYKATVTGDLPDQVLSSSWALRNPTSNAVHLQDRRDPVDRPNTITVSSRIVDANGSVSVEFLNRTATSVRINPDDLYILFNRGVFEWNYLRATLLMLLQLAFLAALGVLAGSFLSFPVAIVLCLALLLVALGRDFISGSVMISSIFAPGVDFITRAGYLSMQLMGLLLPDFTSTWPSSSLADGLYIPWVAVGQAGCLTVGIRCLATLALGCLIFRKRELARVQV